MGITPHHGHPALTFLHFKRWQVNGDGEFFTSVYMIRLVLSLNTAHTGREFYKFRVSCALRQCKVVVVVILGAIVSHGISVSSAGRAVITYQKR